MQWTIEFGGNPQDVTVRTTGEATVDGFRRMNAELVSDALFKAEMFVLVDHTKLAVQQLSSEDVRSISLDAGRHAEVRSATIAVVAPEPLQFGLTRMSAIFAEPEAPNAAVFYTHSEALEWLQKQRDFT